MAASSQGTCNLYSLPVSRRFANAFCLPGTTSVLRHLDLKVSDHRRFASPGLKIAAGSVDDGGEKKGKLMAAEGKPVGRKKRGRRTTGHDALTTIRLSSELRESVDAWAAKQSDKPARSEAIRA